jgi:catechol 2,3-dioxygenase-like lactoylglutathione lyase family enzyme
MKFVSVAVVVSDTKKARAWYTETLGFRLVDDDGDHWVTVAPEGANVALHLCQGSPLEPGNTGIGFTATDVAAVETELRKRGVTFSQSAKKYSWGTVAKFLDPDGNEFSLASE